MVCGCASQSSSKTGVSASSTAFPGPGSASPQPSRTTRQTRLGKRHGAAAAAISHEPVGIEARAAHERAVHVRLGQDLGRVVGLHAAAVEDRGCARAASLGAVAHQRPDERDRLLRDLRRGHLAGADRPDRLVGDHHVGEALVRHPLERLLHLVAELALGLARARAPPRTRPRRGSAGGRRPARPAPSPAARGRSRSCTGAAPSGPSTHAVHAELGEHLGRDLAGERARLLAVHVLRVDRRRRVPSSASHAHVERGERRADADVGVRSSSVGSSDFSRSQ